MKEDPKVELSAPVSQRVELESLLLLETIARRQPLRGKLSTHTFVNVTVKTDAHKKDGVILVQPRFVLVSQFDDDSGDELLRIEAAFLLRYRLPSFEGLRKPNIIAFGEMNGLFNAWPYWREFVQAMTVRMGFPALTIPLHRPLAAQAPSKKNSTGRTSRTKSGKRKKVAAVAR